MASYRVIELQTTKEGIDAQLITACEYHEAPAPEPNEAEEG
jgi:hypothetical protein